MTDLILPRRQFLTGLMGLVAAPAVVRATSLMPVKSFVEVNLPPPPAGFRRLTLADYRRMVEPGLQKLFDNMYEDRSEQWVNIFRSAS
jgi:hypothetical protein